MASAVVPTVATGSGWAPIIRDNDGWNCSLDDPIPALLSMAEDKDKIKIIDVDTFEYEDTIEKPKMSVVACKGFAPTFPERKSPNSAYPFALHDTLILPWDYALKNGVMSLFAHSCTGLSGEEGQACQPCQQLIKNKTLEGIFNWIENGSHERTGFAYHGFSGLQDMLHRKN